MIIILVMIPCAYLYVANQMWKNYEALKNKESQEAEIFGYFSKEVALDEVSKIVGITASFLSTIRTIVMVLVLVFLQKYSVFQLQSFIVMCLVEIIFIFYF